MGACTEPGHLAIVTEFMSKGDVHSVVHNPDHKLSLLKILRMGRDVAFGMNWLHLSKPPILHRDLKPTNLLVDQNWNVKVCDFGLSAFQRTAYVQDQGAAPGTPLWMAPEVLTGQPLSGKADVYAFGIVFWEMITGQDPFAEHESYQSFVDAVCENNERPLIPADLHPLVASLLQQCWAANPDHRPTFGTIIEKLDEAIVGVALIDRKAADMWRQHWPGELSVTFSKFVPILYKAMDAPLVRDRERDLGFKCLKKMLVTVEDTEEVVTLERFGLVLKWFGSIKSAEGNLLQKLHDTLSNSWFHGDIDREAAENLLADFSKKKGTFLVRLSTTDPVEKTPYTISKGAVSHQRVNARSDRSGYYISVKTKKGVEKLLAPGGIENLIKKIGKDLGLSNPCPGSKFYRDIFTVNKVDGYLPTMDDSDSESM